MAKPFEFPKWNKPANFGANEINVINSIPFFWQIMYKDQCRVPSPNGSPWDNRMESLGLDSGLPVSWGPLCGKCDTAYSTMPLAVVIWSVAPGLEKTWCHLKIMKFWILCAEEEVLFSVQLVVSNGMCRAAHDTISLARWVYLTACNSRICSSLYGVLNPVIKLRYPLPCISSERLSMSSFCVCRKRCGTRVGLFHHLFYLQNLFIYFRENIKRLFKFSFGNITKGRQGRAMSPPGFLDLSELEQSLIVWGRTIIVTLVLVIAVGLFIIFASEILGGVRYSLGQLLGF